LLAGTGCLRRDVFPVDTAIQAEVRFEPIPMRARVLSGRATFLRLGLSLLEGPGGTRPR
jgi:hypothetical protein